MYRTLVDLAGLDGSSVEQGVQVRPGLPHTLSIV
jgi:hypothetical protein